MNRILFRSIVFWLVINSSVVIAEINIEKSHYIFNAANEQFLPVIDSSITLARKRLVDILQDTLDYKPLICLRDDLSSFKECIGTAFPDWGAAAAIPYRGLVAIKSPAHFNLGKSLNELVAHEYAHLCLHDRLRPVEPPRWVDEGIAMYVAYEWGWEANFSMSKAAIFNSFISLNDINNLNRFSSGPAQVAYAESYLAVKYFLDEYGTDSFQAFLNIFRLTQSGDSAFLATVGGTTAEFEKEFFDYLKERYNIMSLFGDLYFLWIFLAVVVFLGALLKFLKRKQYYKKWDEEDRLQSRDFDYGDRNNPEQVDEEDKPWN